MLVDSHTHIDTFGDSLPQVLEQCQAAGVGRVMLCGSTLERSQTALRIARKYPDMVTSAAGWHPWYLNEPLGEDVMTAIRGLINDNREHITMVGEIGLDYVGPRIDQQPLQMATFRRFVALALELKMPMTIHVRGPAHADALAVLEEYKQLGPTGSIHGFDGEDADARRYLDIGMMIGAGRPLADGPDQVRLEDVFRWIPSDRLLIETDSANIPGRDFNPTPTYVRSVAEKLAQVRGMPMDEVEDVTRRNFEVLTRAR